MEPSIHIFCLKILSFTSFFLLIIGIRFLYLNRKSHGYEENVPVVFRNFYSEIAFAKKITVDSFMQIFPTKCESIRAYLIKSELKLEVSDVVGAQFVFAFIFIIVACGFIIAANLSLPYLFIGAFISSFIGWLIPEVTVQNIAEERRKKICKEIPYSIDLITAAMASGLDFSAAVRYYVEKVKDTPLSHEYAITLKYLDLGNSKTEALRKMSERLGLPEFSSMVNAVVQGTEMGASIVDTLKINAEEIRRMRMASAEQSAQRAPSLMMLPMLLFIMPSVFIIIFMPIYLKIQQSGLSSMFK